MTRRFIGEYRSKTDLLYRQTVTLDSGMLDVEIVDVSAESENDFPIEQIQWADACLIVYSITDRESFKYAMRALANMKSLQNTISAYLIGNKSDLDHLREVSVKVTLKWGCSSTKTVKYYLNDSEYRAAACPRSSNLISDH